MKKKLLYVFLPIMTFAVIGVNAASAHGLGFMGFGSNATPQEIALKHQEMFTQEAGILGISADKVKQGWAEGKTLQEIAADNGISATDFAAKMKAAAQQKISQQLKALVDQGVITQAQADQRLQKMTERLDNGKGFSSGMGMMHRGYRF